MHVVVLGAGGMLGTDVVKACRAGGIDCTALSSEDCDITDELGMARAVPVCDWVINCAAYSHVDNAEKESAAAMRINRDGAAHIADMCAHRGLAMLHVSTDYVFDGTKQDPYVESDPINPVNVYGDSKFQGEQAVRESGCRAIIARTQSLFGRNGRNFVRAMADRMAGGDDPLRVVNDQVMCPTYTGHLALAIIRLLGCNKQGIVHVSASGACSWYDLACAIAQRLKRRQVVEAVTSDAYKTAARRPLNAVLDTARFERWTGWTMPTWQEGLDAFLAEAELVKDGRPSPAFGTAG